MQLRSLCAPIGLSFALLCACANDVGTPEEAASAAPALANATFREIAAADWELASGAEKYVCVRQVLPASIYVGAWRGITPIGTHHALLTQSVEPDGMPDGRSDCDAAEIGPQTVFGAGVGTSDRVLPPGVAGKLAQGSQILLNLHLFNASDQPLRGHSGVSVVSLDEKDVSVISDTLSAGPIKLEIPPGVSTSRGSCTFRRDATIFGVGPHMHQMGVAMQVIAHTANYGDIMLFDGPYDFEDQRGYPLDMLQFKAGDRVDVVCTYDNTTGKTLHFGTSSNQEMCIAGLGRFPAGGPSNCAN
jgi:hypothetical protein